MRFNEIKKLEPANLFQVTPRSNPEYFYHATNTDNLYDINDIGYLDVFSPWHGTDQDTWPDGSTEKRSYFSSTAENVWQFAPEFGAATIIRIPRNITTFKQESTDDVYTTNKIPAKYIEVLMSNGIWNNIFDL